MGRVDGWRGRAGFGGWKGLESIPEGVPLTVVLLFVLRFNIFLGIVYGLLRPCATSADSWYFLGQS